jgi:hypothetical protein
MRGLKCFFSELSDCTDEHGSRFVNLWLSGLDSECESQSANGESFTPADCKQRNRWSGLSSMAAAAGRAGNPLTDERL